MKWFINEGKFTGNLIEGLIEKAEMSYKVNSYYGTFNFNHTLYKKIKNINKKEK